MTNKQYQMMGAIGLRKHLRKNWDVALEWRGHLYSPSNSSACFIVHAAHNGINKAIAGGAYRALIHPYGRELALQYLNKTIWKLKRGRRFKTLVKIGVSLRMWIRRNRRVDSPAGLPGVPLRGHLPLQVLQGGRTGESLPA